VSRLVLKQGNSAMSIEAVARQTRISKRRSYHRFEDNPRCSAVSSFALLIACRAPQAVVAQRHELRRNPVAALTRDSGLRRS